MSLAGIPTDRALHCESQLEWLTYETVAARAADIQHDRDQSLANMIANSVRKALFGNG